MTGLLIQQRVEASALPVQRTAFGGRSLGRSRPVGSSEAKLGSSWS